MSREVWNLLYEFDNLENIIKNSMMPTEREILNGLSIVKEIIKELNPDEITNEFKLGVEKAINEYKRKLQSQMKVLDSSVDYGIYRGIKLIEQVICFNRLENEKSYVKVRR